MQTMATKKKAKKRVPPKVATSTKGRGRGARPKKRVGKSSVRKPAQRKAPRRTAKSKAPAGKTRQATALARKTARGKAPARKAVAGKGSSRPALDAKRPSRRSTPARTKGKQPANKPAERAAIRNKTDAAPTNPKKVRRYDRPGHLDPRYAAELHAKSGASVDEGRAFVAGARGVRDDLAEELGEEAVEKATSGGADVGEETLDQVVPEELGGPFVETTGDREFADGADPSNPEGATREPFPTT
jgi:hypothetical protein